MAAINTGSLKSVMPSAYRSALLTMDTTLSTTFLTMDAPLNATLMAAFNSKERLSNFCAMNPPSFQ